MFETKKEILDYFDAVINFNELKFDESYKAKLFEYTKNMLDGNKTIYDIDVSSVEPKSLVSCLKEAKYDK